jgi:hypothetical protein
VILAVVAPKIPMTARKPLKVFANLIALWALCLVWLIRRRKSVHAVTCVAFHPFLVFSTFPSLCKALIALANPEPKAYDKTLVG